MKISRNRKGFTLIELLIVVAIIGILAAVAIPAYTGYTAKAKIAGVVHSMGAIKNALAAYYTESGSSYPEAGTAALIASTFGVEPATQYATYSVAALTAGTPPTGGAITATIQNVSGDTDGKTIILKPNFGTSAPYNLTTWTWDDTATIPASYLPKS